MKVVLEIDNVYEEIGTVHTTVEANIESPPTLDEDAEEYQQWACEEIDQHTGTGHTTGNSAYFVTITECDDSALIGRKFEFGL